MLLSSVSLGPTSVRVVHFKTGRSLFLVRVFLSRMRGVSALHGRAPRLVSCLLFASSHAFSDIWCCVPSPTNNIHHHHHPNLAKLGVCVHCFRKLCACFWAPVYVATQRTHELGPCFHLLAIPLMGIPGLLSFTSNSARMLKERKSRCALISASPSSPFLQTVPFSFTRKASPGTALLYFEHMY